MPIKNTCTMLMFVLISGCSYNDFAKTGKTYPPLETHQTIRVYTGTLPSEVEEIGVLSINTPDEDTPKMILRAKKYARSVGGNIIFLKTIRSTGGEYSRRVYDFIIYRHTGTNPTDTTP